MESIHFQHNALTAAEITTRRLCRLHRVRLFSPALCRVKRGSKVIVQGESRVLATPQQLIVLPADVELEVINQPENGLFCSDLLSLTPELLTRFKTRYLSEPPPGRLTSLCAPVTTRAGVYVAKRSAGGAGGIVRRAAAAPDHGTAAGPV